MFDQRSALFTEFLAKSIHSYPLSAARLASSPAEVRFVACFRRTVDIEDRLTLCVDESGCFERLDAVVRPAVVVFAGVSAVEKRRVHRGVLAWIVQLRRQAQQHARVPF